MIPRYTLPEMGALWTDQAKLATWVEVEILACEAHHELGVVPAEDLAAIRKGEPPTPERVSEIEATTDHDVIAFLTAFAETIPGAEREVDAPADTGESTADGEHPSRWVHYGMTSSDLIDTALGATLARATDLVLDKADRLVAVLKRRALEHWHDVCVGRTHGVHAEPTTFGHKLAQFAFAVDRGRTRLRAAREAVAVGSISGAVGTYSNIDPFVEQYVCEKLGLGIEPVATQVVARDRHAELLSALAMLGASVEQLGTEIRHLQRTEVREAEESFGSGQKGSSAMPHKRNPIRSERLVGIARLLRGNAVAAMESIALWHERDISHSSTERVVLPDSLIVADYQLDLARKVVEGLRVDPERMRVNLDATGGLVVSSRVLLDVVDRLGVSRDAAYEVVQAAAMRTWESGRPFRDTLAEEGVELDEEALAPERFLERHHVVRERLEALEP
ncbi:adenylosuccinate lyase [Egibacter rhizosphaerae]|uniref:Adenylosuccinate lyase n=1 Tax=Egibacter rhizosphaerae TaxID=1670831 RepID=A0A411YG62_9ACTN|nr:adenylosuccinate lyase [Egibacter rhizosphaerae]QBI20169.1 adenylosuccinate lyase [Egibacter rhizosphaerae]